jgi:hypothetical protein
MKSKISKGCFLHTIDLASFIDVSFFGDQAPTRILKENKKTKERECRASQKSIGNDLDDQAGGVGDPLGVAGNAGESSGESLGASGAGDEADDADLVVDASVDEAQWAARVSLYQINLIFKFNLSGKI